MIVLIGIKIGMTRIFNSNNVSIPITVIKIYNNIITLINSNVNRIQITLDKVNKKKVIRPIKKFFIKNNLKPGIGGLWSIPYIKNLHKKVGQSLNLRLFKDISNVDITGYSKGKGFAGTIKRWNFKSQDSSHGNSLSHRVPGSIGQNQTPGRVLKGKKMSGHLGNEKVTIQNLKIIDLDLNKKILLIKGSVPGYNKSFLYIKSTIKNNKK